MIALRRRGSRAAPSALGFDADADLSVRVREVFQMQRCRGVRTQFDDGAVRLFEEDDEGAIEAMLDAALLGISLYMDFGNAWRQEQANLAALTGTRTRS